MTEIHGLDELNRRVLQTGSCAGCGACVGRCPYLTAFKGKTVMLDSCTVEHGRCFAYCPMTFFDAEAMSQFVFGQSSDGLEIGHRCSRPSGRHSYNPYDNGTPRRSDRRSGIDHD
jgi:Na+-translocating ferredoxin:NAD+ oxidoreductase RNF subunit RnfB